MTSHFSPKVSEVLAFSREEATRLASSSVGPEHLLLGMMREKNGSIANLFQHLSVNLDNVKHQLEDRVRDDSVREPIITSELVLNQKANEILKKAVLEARIQKTELVDVQHILLAILHDQTDNGAKDVLELNNITYEDAFSYLQTARQPKNSLGITDDEEDLPMDNSRRQQSSSSSRQATRTAQPGGNGKTPVLDNFSTDLTKAASEGKLDPVVGREREIQRVIEILMRRKKNNPILIGEPGVGKSAIVEGLAQLIADHKTSPVLFNKRVVSLDMTAIVAGTKYRGQFEERIRELIKELEHNSNIIVFIDEIHTLIGAGGAPGTMDAANILKPALARGVIQCIGATTLDEYRNSIEKDGALERRFQKVLVEPTTAEETLQILQNIKDRYEQHHHVSYTDGALEACVKLTDRYISDRFFPDKAIDAMDEVGSRLHLRTAKIPPEITDIESQLEELKNKKRNAVADQNFELAVVLRDKQSKMEAELEDIRSKWANDDIKDRTKVTGDDVADVVSMMTGVPVQRIQQSEGIRLKDLSANLKGTVIGQDGAIDKMVKAIQRNRLGLREPNHPIGVFMFLGPTGVGKTYLAKQLAKQMFGSDDALIRIDMSEYTESFNVSRLIGAPPGYVGYEEGGQLTERVRRHPYSIVLLDEIEKAHGNVFNLLLQVLDEGRLTDGNGRLVDFRNTVIVMTSNAGTRQLKEFGQGVGFTAHGISGTSMNDSDRAYARSIIQKNLSKQFAPEFLNRLDEIITFEQLDMESIKHIIDLELRGLYQRVEDLGYHLDVTEEAKEFVATKGYDIQYGARPLKRAIQNYIEDGLCEKILSGDLNAGETITVGKDADSDKLTFSNTAVETQPVAVGN